MQIVWARYVAATLIAFGLARPMAAPGGAASRSARGCRRCARCCCSGRPPSIILALRQLQLPKTATISFLTPIFVALLAGPLLGERVGGERMVAIVVGFLRRSDRDPAGH